MVDLTAISSAASGFKAAIDIAKGIQSLNTTTEVRQKTSELLDAVVEGRFKLLEASDAQSALLARIKELEEKIASFEDWDREKERYELQAIDTGAFAYMYQPDRDYGEPAIWLCQTCFEKRHKSPFQFRGQDIGSGSGSGRGTHSRWGCNLCKSEVVVHYQRNPTTPWPDITSPDPDPPQPGGGMASVKLTRC